MTDYEKKRRVLVSASSSYMKQIVEKQKIVNTKYLEMNYTQISRYKKEVSRLCKSHLKVIKELEGL